MSRTYYQSKKELCKVSKNRKSSHQKSCSLFFSISLYALGWPKLNFGFGSHLWNNFSTFKTAFLMQIARFERLSNPISHWFCYCFYFNKNCLVCWIWQDRDAIATFDFSGTFISFMAGLGQKSSGLCMLSCLNSPSNSFKLVWQSRQQLRC